MTPLFVLCYIIYTTITSTILSLLLALRRIFSLRTSEEIGNVIALYEGTVYHERRHPARNAFRFLARYALIDLDRPPYSPPNYLSADDARRAAKTNGPVHLLRIPSSLGYERSPVNYYYCYEIEGSTKILKKCLVEASNTPWGESVTFVFNPSSDLVPKSEYISPFMDMLGSWRLKVSEPSENLFTFIAVEHPQLGTYFRASFTATKLASSINIRRHHLFFQHCRKGCATFVIVQVVVLWWSNIFCPLCANHHSCKYQQAPVVNSHELLSVVAAVHHEGVGKPLNNGALSLPETPRLVPSRCVRHEYKWCNR
ncbi:hypothetical protein SASPL_126310 [Salvia splendens]|uniref:Uncharacterized protein n=1 Tax=Salvia splendens TaxID=180675 RepID=A0A8X8XLK9_SALSN|nr:hypothetical protein SASPL_126310 [Salvia splendens]